MKLGNQLQEIYPTDYNLLIVQDLWQAHYKILSITFLKEFIKLNVNLDMMIKVAQFEICTIKYKYCDYFLAYVDFRDDLIENNVSCKRNYQQRFDE